MSEIRNYDEYPRSQFPGAIDNWDNMQDVTVSLKPVVERYEKLWAQNDSEAIAALIVQYPELLSCLFNAEKYNQLSDGIKALQKFYKEEVEIFLQELAQKTVGINDNATGDEMVTNTFSAEKLTRWLNSITAVKSVPLPESSWSSASPYTQVVAVEGSTTADSPIIGLSILDGSTASDVKAQSKAWACVDRAVAGDGVITFYCYNKKPVTSFVVNVKGV